MTFVTKLPIHPMSNKLKLRNLNQLHQNWEFLKSGLGHFLYASRLNFATNYNIDELII